MRWGAQNENENAPDRWRRRGRAGQGAAQQPELELSDSFLKHTIVLLSQCTIICLWLLSFQQDHSELMKYSNMLVRECPCTKWHTLPDILPKYRDSAKVFLKLWRESAKNLPTLCQGSAKVLPKFCQNSAKILPRFYKKFWENFINIFP